jgi:hypothetical protein
MSLQNLSSLGVPVKEILMRMPVNELFNNCVVSQEFNEFCNNDNFWKDYLFQYTRITQKISPLSYKQTTRLIFHFLNRLWEDPNLELISTWALDNFVKFWNETSDTYDQYLSRFNQIAQGIFNTHSNVFSWYTFASVFPSINTDFTLEEMFTDYYEPKFEIDRIVSTNRYVMPLILKSLSQPMTYIQRSQQLSNQKVVDISYNPDDSLHYLYIEIEEDPNKIQEVEIKDFIVFSIENFI